MTTMGEPKSKQREENLLGISQLNGIQPKEFIFNYGSSFQFFAPEIVQC